MKTIGKPFAPGVSGNPGGRPKSLASYIRETTDGGREMVDLMVAVMRGEAVGGKKPRIRDQMDAAGWLMDRGFGRPVAQIDATSRTMNMDLSLQEINTEELIALLNRAATPELISHQVQI
ncbi:hypothetical protein M1N56_06075 [Dehalococcoidia bacterium]|nr:hypothetical protein [Dehalococcoidia bacterium]